MRNQKKEGGKKVNFQNTTQILIGRRKEGKLNNEVVRKDRKEKLKNATKGILEDYITLQRYQEGRKRWQKETMELWKKTLKRI